MNNLIEINSVESVEDVQISRVLRNLMRQRQIKNPNSLARLMKAAGSPVSQPVLHRLYSGKQKTAEDETINALANFFDVLPGQIRGEVSLSVPPGPATSTGEVEQRIQTRRLVVVPLLRWEEIMDYSSDRNSVESPLAMEVVLDERAHPAHGRFAAPVRGTSMINPAGVLPTFVPGMRLLCNRDLEPKNGCFLIVRRAEEYLPVLRQYILDGDRTMLHALNPQYPDEPLRPARDEIIAVVEDVTYGAYYDVP